MTGARILVVDDEKAIRDGLQKVLEGEGYEAELSHNGYSAVEKLQTTDFELVITDLKMPGMDGIEVLNTISILQPNVPVIFITGYSTVENAVEVMKIGAFDYLPKPFTPKQILEKVNKALEHRAFLLEEHSPARHLSEQIEGINKRDRQRAGGEGDSPAKPPTQQTVHSHRLHHPGRESPGKRTVRPREGILHRSRADQDRLIQGGRRRNTLPR
jgi:FixJ family two-component response regulator